METNNYEVLNQLLGTPQQAEIVKAANNFVKPKVIQIEDKHKIITAKVARFILPIISMFLGYQCLLFYFGKKIDNYYVVMLISCILLVFIEAGKYLTLKPLVKRIKVLKRTGIDDYLFAGIFSITSITLATVGMYQFTVNTDHSVQNFENLQSSKLDSIRLNFDKQITFQQAQIDTINSYKKGRWAGLLTKPELSLIQSYQKEISQLKQAKNNEIAEAKKDFAPMDKAVKSTFDTVLIIDVIIALLLESLIVAVNIYLAIVLIKISEENKLFQFTGNTTINTTLENISGLIQAIQVNQLPDNMPCYPTNWTLQKYCLLVTTQTTKKLLICQR